MILRMLRSTNPWSEEEVQVFVEQNLIFRVSFAEVLQKRMSQLHNLVHLLIILEGNQTNHSREGWRVKQRETTSE